jgi:Flp pilus assembly protein TadD
MANSARIDELQRRFAENPRRYFAPLANEYRKNGNLEQAILICQEYLPQQPGHMSGHIVYGQTLFEAGRFAEARVVFETALSLDPENLIALHHLGDIARQLGDVGAARGWYRRVLETDPRNEEITKLLAELDKPAAPAEEPAAVSSAFASGLASSVDSLSIPPIPLAPGLAGTEEMALEKGAAQPLGFEATDLAASEPVAQQAVEEPVAEADAPDELELVTLDASAEERAPSQEMRGEIPTAAPDAPVAEAPVPVEPPILAEEEPEPAAAEAEPAWEPSGMSEITAEEEFAAADNSGSSTPESSHAAAIDESAALDAALFGDTVEMPAVDKSYEGMELSADAVQHEAGDFEREVDIFDTPDSTREAGSLTVDAPLVPTPASGEGAIGAEDIPESAPIDGGHDGQEVPAAPSEMFVTETMAELYLRQGHLESALDIFRRLVAQRPTDARLRERLRAVEDLLYGKTVEIEAVPPPSRSATPPMPATPAAAMPALVTPAEVPVVDQSPEPPTEEAVSEAPRERMATPGPTIRQFLAGILAKRPTPVTHEAANGNERVETASAEPAPAGSLDTLFAGAATSDSDIGAATALAEAFSSDDTATTPLRGLPAHRAANELSLDNVFRTPAQGSDATSAFSFDRFFSEESIEPDGPAAAETPPATAGSAEDIAEFNAWLSGLRKT